MSELKPLSPDAVSAALEKAMRYRLLNEPWEAESICRDVLAIDSANQQALATLVLALTDQFESRLAATYQEAHDIAALLASEYEREYYTGIICERRAKAHHAQAMPDSGSLAYDWLRKAMVHYENAEPLGPKENDEAVLRWNTCARALERFPEIRPVESGPSPAIDLE